MKSWHQIILAVAAATGLIVGGVKIIAEASADVGLLNDHDKAIKELRTNQSSDHESIQRMDLNVALLCQASNLKGCRVP